jgi:vanillate O-demethylase monooxygenase subunit
MVIMNAASPISARITRLFAPIARNFDTDLPVQDVYDFNGEIFREDKRIVEAQKTRVPFARP